MKRTSVDKSIDLKWYVVYITIHAINITDEITGLAF